MVKQLFVEPDQVVEAAESHRRSWADSLDMAELAIKFEQEFGFQISDEAAELIRTVGDAVKFIERYVIGDRFR